MITVFNISFSTFPMWLRMDWLGLSVIPTPSCQPIHSIIDPVSVILQALILYIIGLISVIETFSEFNSLLLSIISISFCSGCQCIWLNYIMSKTSKQSCPSQLVPSQSFLRTILKNGSLWDKSKMDLSWQQTVHSIFHSDHGWLHAPDAALVVLW